MVTFTGHITGKAASHYMKKYISQTLLVGVPAVLAGVLASFYIGTNILHFNDFTYWMLIALAVGIIISVVLHFIPNLRLAMLPQLIYTEDGKITCVSETYTEVASIDDVYKVIDYGEFYKLCFPYGKISYKFICQKDLLTKGSLEEFEELFAGKIVKNG